MALHFYRSIKPIQAMTFDLDDTLYDNRPVIALLEQNMVQWMHQHHPVSQKMFPSAWLQLKRDLAEQQPFLISDVTRWRFEQVRHGLIMLGYSAAQAIQAAQEAMQQMLMLRHQIDVPSITHQVMTQLQQQVPLIAITNGNVIPERIGLGQYFDLVLNAGPDGWAKPHADMFVTALQYLDLLPQQVLHVGDHLLSDVAGAKYAGMQACWLNDQGVELSKQADAKVLPDVEITSVSDLLHLFASQ